MRAVKVRVPKEQARPVLDLAFRHGIGGATTGMAAGAALERNLADGIPHDELFLYEDALRNGRSVVTVFAGSSPGS